jgi:hypothetical protein
VRLEELHLVALEERIDAELELGHAAELVPELQALAAAYPLRERFWAQLMLSLYRAGRPAEALRRTVARTRPSSMSSASSRGRHCASCNGRSFCRTKRCLSFTAGRT